MKDATQTHPSVSEADGAQKSRIFISYSRKNPQFAEALQLALQVGEFAVVLDKTDIAPDEPWKERLTQLIIEADSVICIVSPESLASEICNWEIAEAKRLHKRMIPVVYRTIDPVAAPPGLAHLDWIFFNKPDARRQALSQLFSALEEDLDWARAHTRLAQRAELWVKRGKPASLVLRGRALSDAERWRSAAPIANRGLSAEQSAFIDSSRQAATKRQRVVIGGALSAALIALLLSAFAFLQRSEAVQQRSIAQHSEREALLAKQDAESAALRATAGEERAKLALDAAKTQRDRALLAQSEFLTDVANQKVEKADRTTAMLLAIEALPIDNAAASNDERPFFPPAAMVLYKAEALPGERRATESERKAIAKLSREKQSYVSDAFQVSGSNKAIKIHGLNIDVVDQKTQQATSSFPTDHKASDADKLQAMAILPDLMIATIAHSRVLVYDIGARAKIAEFKTDFFSQDSTPTPIALSLDKRRVAIPVEGKKIAVWDGKSRKTIATFGPFSSAIGAVRLDATGQQIAIQTMGLSEESRQWIFANIQTGAEALRIPATAPPFSHAEFLDKDRFVILDDDENGGAVVRVQSAGASSWPEFFGDLQCPSTIKCSDLTGAQDNKGLAVLTAADVSAPTADPASVGLRTGEAYLSFYDAGKNAARWRSKISCVDNGASACSLAMVLEPDHVCMSMGDKFVRRWLRSNGQEAPATLPCQANQTGFVREAREKIAPPALDPKKRALVQHLLSQEQGPALLGADGALYLAPFHDDRASTPVSKLKRWPMDQTVQTLIQRAQQSVSRCLLPKERQAYFLEAMPPDWCFEMKKQPYASKDWALWRKYKTAAKTSPPMPDSPDWTDWAKDKN